MFVNESRRSSTALRPPPPTLNDPLTRGCTAHTVPRLLNGTYTPSAQKSAPACAPPTMHKQLTACGSLARVRAPASVTRSLAPPLLPHKEAYSCDTHRHAHYEQVPSPHIEVSQEGEHGRYGERDIGRREDTQRRCEGHSKRHLAATVLAGAAQTTAAAAAAAAAASAAQTPWNFGVRVSRHACHVHNHATCCNRSN